MFFRTRGKGRCLGLGWRGGGVSARASRRGFRTASLLRKGERPQLFAKVEKNLDPDEEGEKCSGRRKEEEKPTLTSTRKKI